MKINRRRLLQALGMSPALFAGSAAEAQAANATATSGEYKLVGLNPKGMPPAITLVPMAPRRPRFDSLEGKTIYMVDIGFNNGDVFFQEMQRWFKEHMPSVKTIYRRKAGDYPQDDPKLWAEIKAAGAAVIMGVGH
jgi:ABC-type nitrate/sulfonate/bicarbonate transport system substrate-binding protein